MTYASSTSVSVEKSRAEIERTLAKYGADQFAYGWDRSAAMIGFALEGRQVRFVLPLPDRDDRIFTHTPAKNQRRTEAAAHQAWEQACRARWRALFLVIKAKLEAVESGITEFEDEFLAHILLPNGTTAGEWLRPQIESAYQTGTMPGLLAIGTGE